MPPSTWSLEDAKNRFGSLIEIASRGKPQTVTKHGKPAVVIVAAAEYARLRLLDRLRSPTFTQHLLAMPIDDGGFDRFMGLLRDQPPKRRGPVQSR